MNSKNANPIKCYKPSIPALFCVMLLTSCAFFPSYDCKEGKIATVYEKTSPVYQDVFLVYDLQTSKTIQSLPFDPKIRLTDMALSPDGNHILYGNDVDSSLYLLDLQSGQRKQIYKGYRPSSPVWSPSGNDIAFADGAVTIFAHAYIMDINNISVIQPLSPNYDRYDQLFEIPIAWSSSNDNNILLENNQDDKPTYALILIHPDGSGRKLIYASQYIWEAALSTNGKMLVLKEGYSLKEKPFLYDWQLNKKIELPNMPSQSDAFSWSPSGKCIAFFTPVGKTQTYQLNVYNLETDTITNLPFPQLKYYGIIDWVK